MLPMLLVTLPMLPALPVTLPILGNLLGNHFSVKTKNIKKLSVTFGEKIRFDRIPFSALQYLLSVSRIRGPREHTDFGWSPPTVDFEGVGLSFEVGASGNGISWDGLHGPVGLRCVSTLSFSLYVRKDELLKSNKNLNLSTNPSASVGIL